MARIADGVIERLKTEVSVQRLAEARGVMLTKHGADLHGHCPFHADRMPSLVITPAKNLWHCLGACQTGGTAIDWVMRAEGVSFRHAVELLQNDALPLAVTSSIPTPPPKQSTVKKLAMPLEREADDAKSKTTRNPRHYPREVRALPPSGADARAVIDVVNPAGRQRVLSSIELPWDVGVCGAVGAQVGRRRPNGARTTASAVSVAPEGPERHGEAEDSCRKPPAGSLAKWLRVRSG